RVERAVEVLALAQPVLLRHVLALAQVASDGEGALASAGDDGDADRRQHGDRLEDLRQPRSHLGGDRVVRVRAVESDERYSPLGEMLEEDGLLELLPTGRRRPEVECVPAVGTCR